MDDAALEDAITSFSRLNAVMEPLRVQLWETYEITVTQIRVMYLIRQYVEPSVRDLAAELKITGPTMSGIIDRLIQRRVAERRQDVIDRRVVRVLLTREGEELLGVIERGGRAVLSAAFQQLGNEATRRLANDLAALADAVSNVVEADLAAAD